MIQFKVNAYYIDNYKAIFIVKRSAKSVTFTDAFGKTHRKPIKIIAGNECISGKSEGSYFANLEISAMRAKQLMQKEVDMWRKFNDEQEAEYAETYGVVDDVHDDDFDDCVQTETTEVKALPATASQTTKHTRKSKQEIIPFQLGMFYIANIDGRNFNARVTAFIEHFRNFSKADKNGKIKNKIVRTKDVCFDVLYNGEIKHVQAGISIDKDSGCEYITTVIYPPIKISADNPVECATPHTASDITPVYKFKPDERYPLTLREYYGNIKCVSFCNSSQVTFEFGAYNSEALHEQDLLTVPIFVDPETKSQFVLFGSRTCYAHDPIQEVNPVESNEDNSKSQQNDHAHTFSKCPHCGSSHKPYVKLCKTKTAMRAKMKTGSGVAEICDYLRVRCRDCGYEEHTIIHSSGNGTVIKRTRDEAMTIAIKKWNNPIKDNAVVLSTVKTLSENAPEQTRMPRKRHSVTLEDIRSCENEKQIVAMLIKLSFNALISFAVDILDIPQAHFRGMNKKNVLASFIACRVILMRKILAQNNSHQQEQTVKPEKTVSREQEAQSESCADNFYMTMDEKTGQFSFIFE